MASAATSSESGEAVSAVVENAETQSIDGNNPEGGAEQATAEQAAATPAPKVKSSATSRHPKFRSGDKLKVHVRVKEGDKERIQVFEGYVIRFKKGGAGSFTIRKMSFGIGVERLFPLDSPMIAKIDVVARGDVARSRLYYLRQRTGKAARIAEIRERK